MKVRIVLKMTGWLLIIALGVIHFFNREEISVLYSGFKGFIFNASFFVGLGLVVFANPSGKIKKGKTAMFLLCIGLILFISGIIFIETLELGAIALLLIFISVIMVISSDFMTEDFKIET